MNHLNRPALSTAFVLAIFVLGLAGCATGPQLDQPAAPGIGPTLPPAFPPQDIVGRWGLAAYHKDEDRARTEQAAIAGCKQPYVITLGPTGGVMMHLPTKQQPNGASRAGRVENVYRTADSESEAPVDREVVHWMAVLILRWVD